MNNIVVLNSTKYDGAVNCPVIRTIFYDKIVDISNYEAIVFTSKNAVEAANKTTSLWKNLPSYSIGMATSTKIKELGGILKYESSYSYSPQFANELNQLLKDKKVLYIRAKKVLGNLKESMSNVNLDEVVLYETVCNDEVLKKPAKNSTIIFSSPSSIKCFFKNFEWDESYEAIAIGKKTSSFLDVEHKVSEVQSIDEIIKNLITF